MNANTQGLYRILYFKPAAWWYLIWHCPVCHVIQKCGILDVFKQSSDEVMCNCNSGSEVAASEFDDSIPFVIEEVKFYKHTYSTLNFRFFRTLPENITNFVE
jgi:hypothetical protein